MSQSARGRWSWFHLIVGAIFLAIGIALLVGASSTTSSDARLQTEGQTLTADVVDAREVQYKRGGTTTSTSYEIKYRFTSGSLLSGGSVIISDWMDAPEAVVRDAVRQGTIEIRYLPGEPSVNKPVASLGVEVGSFGFPVGPIIAGVLFLGVGGLILWGGRPGAIVARRPSEAGPTPEVAAGGGPVA